MSLILCLESSTTVCSAALFKNDTLLASEEINAGFTHAENLHVFIQKVLKDAGETAGDLNAVAVSKGPGSYTGLRIGVSAAKGLAYALNIPLISIDTLQLLAASARVEDSTLKTFVPMIDARRMEVYTAVYDQNLKMLQPVSALILDEESIVAFAEFSELAFFGDGMEKARPLLSTVPGAQLLEGLRPAARQMGSLAYEKFTSSAFEDTAYFEPYYLKEFQAGKKKC